MDLYFLKQHKGKTVDELIEAGENELRLKKEEEIKREERLNEIKKHGFFKINFNSLSVMYCSINQDVHSFKADTVSVYNSQSRVSIEIEDNRPLNSIWFLDKKGVISVERIDSKDYNKVRDLFESTKIEYKKITGV